MIEDIMLFSPNCHACESTKPLNRLLEVEFRDFVEFRYISVAEPEIILRMIPNFEDYMARLLDEKFSLPIEEDQELSEEEKASYRKRGITKLPALPTFITRNVNRPFQYELMVGGVGQDHAWKDDKEFLNERRKSLMKWVKADVGISFPDWKFRSMYQNPYREV